eukprot:160087_1
MSKPASAQEDIVWINTYAKAQEWINKKPDEEKKQNEGGLIVCDFVSIGDEIVSGNLKWLQSLLFAAVNCITFPIWAYPDAKKPYFPILSKDAHNPVFICSHDAKDKIQQLMCSMGASDEHLIMNLFVVQNIKPASEQLIMNQMRQLNMKKKLPQPTEQLTIWKRIGNLIYSGGDILAALLVYQASFSFATKELKPNLNCKLQAKICNNISVCYEKLGIISHCLNFNAIALTLDPTYKKCIARKKRLQILKQHKPM